MRTLAAIAGLAVFGASAFAQLDRLLTPLAVPSTVRASGSVAVAKGEDAGGAEVHAMLGAGAFLAELEKELTARMSVTGELKLSLTRSWLRTRSKRHGSISPRPSIWRGVGGK